VLRFRRPWQGAVLGRDTGCGHTSVRRRVHAADRSNNAGSIHDTQDTEVLSLAELGSSVSHIADDCWLRRGDRGRRPERFEENVPNKESFLPPQHPGFGLDQCLFASRIEYLSLAAYG
jgi:hypothetical protein